ncbi:SDR family NAD(P)-dependent oxidoreductase [Pediococcus argentinicus]|uniref:Uncharacterized protein n=1 Tax=Pediococcus argentinicus TaxID=480391 RepID=A0A0R2N4U2_9LACO|nr:SDR family NAD(P)-dependent oxidoreductase [Pediococcus argentinicus]KRO20806.1 hypothetical protein IV88_GL001485 [Pediococcus argentinicus]NKZ22616.1 SDR family NAD(P)-dependent oxidoreductase [Pediococcus argentinicus]GEP20359.1 short-chain dehydrogenase [Pediococcus argentinicus]
MNNIKKQAVIFGGTSGVGRHTAIQLANEGWKIIIVGRNDHGTVDYIKNNTHNNDIVFYSADLSDKVNITSVVSKISQSIKQVDALFITIGTIQNKLLLTNSGMDTNIVINYLSQVWIIMAMKSLLRHGSQILLVGGLPFLVKHLHIADIDFKSSQNTDNYNANSVISNTLSARILLTMILSEKLASEQISVNIFHPGYIPDSHLSSGTAWYLKLMGSIFAHFSVKNSPIGAELVTNNKYLGLTGKFIDDRGRIVKLPASFSKEQADRLWKSTQPLL